MKYTATSVVQLAAGALVGLSKEQAASRQHCTTPHASRKGWFTATGPLQFKAGEEFQYEGDLPKGMAEAAEAAKRAPTKAEQAAADKAAAIDAAQAKLADAEKVLADASTDEARAKASEELEAARAALAKLKV